MDIDKGIVPSSVKSVSSNVGISGKREWLFYNFAEINLILRKVDDILKERPKQLLSEELNFLGTYKEDFQKYRMHNGFRLATTDYIALLTKALEALDSRIKIEGQVAIEKRLPNDTTGQIVIAFSQISSILRDIKNTFFTNLAMIQLDPKRYIKVIRYL